MNKEKNEVSIKVSLVANLISIIVSIIVSFFITKYIIVNIGKESYSFYPTAVNFSNYFTTIFLLLNGLSSRYLIKPYLGGRIDEASEYFSTIFLSNVLISIVVAIAESIFYLNLESLLNIPINILNDVKLLFLLIFITSIIKGLFGGFSTVYYVKNRMDIRAYEIILTNIIKGILLIFALVMNKLTLVFFGFTLFITVIFEVLIDFISYLLYMKDIQIKIKLYSFDKLLIIFKNGIWQLISQSGTLLITNVQLIVSNIFLGIESSSTLSLAQPLFTLCSMLITTISELIDPMITKNVIKYSDKSRKNISYLYYLHEFFTIIPIIMVMTFSNHFYDFWIPNENSKMLFVLTFLTCIETLIGTITIVYNSILSTYFKMKEKAIMYLLSGLLNILIVYVMLEYTNLGNVGILLSAIIANYLYYIVFIPKYGKKILIDDNKEIEINTIKNVLLYVILALLDLLISLIMPINNLIVFIIICGVTIIINYAIVFAVRKIKLHNFINFIREVC